MFLYMYKMLQTFEEHKSSWSWHLSPHPHQWIPVMSVGSLGHLYCRLLIGTCLAKWGLHTNWIKCQQYPIMGTNLQYHYRNLPSILFTTELDWSLGYYCHSYLSFSIFLSFPPRFQNVMFLWSAQNIYSRPVNCQMKFFVCFCYMGFIYLIKSRHLGLGIYQSHRYG